MKTFDSTSTVPSNDTITHSITHLSCMLSYWVYSFLQCAWLRCVMILTHDRGKSLTFKFGLWNHKCKAINLKWRRIIHSCKLHQFDANELYYTIHVHWWHDWCSLFLQLVIGLFTDRKTGQSHPLSDCWMRLTPWCRHTNIITHLLLFNRAIHAVKMVGVLNCTGPQPLKFHAFEARKNHWITLFTGLEVEVSTTIKTTPIC